jgi:hypothetical protein
MCRQSASVCLTESPAGAQRAASGIADRLSVLRDPRDRRGRRHSLAAVLLADGFRRRPRHGFGAVPGRWPAGPARRRRLTVGYLSSNYGDVLLFAPPLVMPEAGPRGDVRLAQARGRSRARRSHAQSDWQLAQNF